MPINNINVEQTDGANTTPVKPRIIATPTPAATPPPTPTITVKPPVVPTIPSAPIAPKTDPILDKMAQSGYSQAPRPDNIGTTTSVKIEDKAVIDTGKVEEDKKVVVPDTKVTDTKVTDTKVADTKTADTGTTVAQDNKQAEYEAEITKIAQEQSDFEAAQKESLDKVMEMVNEPNKYIEELNGMTFDYNPQQDPEYLRNAAGLENQIAQTMVGRGGLYSSVASSALNASLINLQMNMTSQKRQEFIENRNFTLQLAQNEQNIKMDSFNQMMAIREAEAKDRTAALDEYLALAKYEADIEQRKFENAMKQEQWNAEQEQIRFENSITNQELALRKEAAIKDAQISGLEQDYANKSATLVNDFALYNDLVTNYSTIVQKWKTGSQTADANTVRFFKQLGIDIRPGATFVETSRERQYARNMLYEFEQKIRTSSLELQMNSQLLDGLKSISETAPTKTEPIPDVKVTKNADGSITESFTRPMTDTEIKQYMG